MKIEKTLWVSKAGWKPHTPRHSLIDANLVLLLGSICIIKNADFFGSIQALYPNAVITGCSTAGEIHGTNVSDGSLTCTSIKFENTRCVLVEADIHYPEESHRMGVMLTEQLEKEQLRHVLLLSDKLNVNGTELIKGMQSRLPSGINITGGLAADGELFKETYVIAHGKPAQKKVVAVGLYSDTLSIGYGSFGGWDPFGPERLITRASGNILYELDGLSALSLYKKYLGDYAHDLPASALLFPLAVRAANDSRELVRTILGIREDENCMIFAGDVPEGFYARFMKCNMDRLIDGGINGRSLIRQNNQWI